MAKFDKEIQRLQAFLNSPSNDMIKTEVAVQKLDNLMRLDGWEPSGLAERISTLESQLEALEDAVHSLVERVSILERPGHMGFGKSE